MMYLKLGKSTPAMTNTERQRRFRERNPGYYGRLHRKRKAKIVAMRAASEAAAVVPVAQPVRVPLALPAPVETVEILGMTAIPTLAELHAQRDAVTVNRSAA